MADRQNNITQTGFIANKNLLQVLSQNLMQNPYRFVLNKKILKTVLDIVSSKKGQYEKEKALLAKVTIMQVRDKSITDEDLPAISEIVRLGEFTELDLKGCDISDASALGAVHTLNLSRTRVTDVSMLGDVHTLKLSYTDVRDVSMLGKVHALKLMYTRVISVSGLTAVHTLDLRGTKVSNVSALSKVHMLYLNFTNVIDVSALGKVDILHLRRTGISDVSALSNVHELDLSFTNIADVSMLGAVHRLDLSFTNVTDVSALASVHKLTIVKATVVSALMHLANRLNQPYFEITEGEAKNLQALSRVRKLIIRNKSVEEMIKRYKLKQASKNSGTISYSRKHFKSPLHASAISRFSSLSFDLLRGNLATVKPLAIADYAAVTEEKKRMLADEIKAAVEKTLKHYNALWQTSSEHETTRSSYVALAGWRINGLLEDVVKSIIQFFNTSRGHWHAGKRTVSGRGYEKGKGPSIKTLLMKYLLTVDSFQREVVGDKLHLITAELAHGLAYDLDLTKDFFGGCNIKGLICFFENECKREGGLGKPTAPTLAMKLST